MDSYVTTLEPQLPLDMLAAVESAQKMADLMMAATADVRAFADVVLAGVPTIPSVPFTLLAPPKWDEIGSSTRVDVD